MTYTALFTALDEAHEVQTCLTSVHELIATGAELDARADGGRDRLSVLLGYLLRRQSAAMDAIDEALRQTRPTVAGGAA